MILFLGIVTSYQDIKIGKIKNKWIVLALVYALVVNAVLMIYINYTTGIRMHYVFELITNFVFAIAVGFGLWYFNVWSAADGKLLIAFSALIPLSTYSLGYQEWVPSFILLINIFIPSLIIMVIWMTFRIKRNNASKVLGHFLKDFFEPKQLFDSILHLFAIYWIMGVLLFQAGFGNNFLLNIVMTVVVFAAIRKKLGNNTLYVALAIMVLRFIIDKSVYNLDFLISFLMLVFVWRLIRSFLMGATIKMGSEIFTIDVGIDKLKPAMILGEAIQKKEKMSEKELISLKNKKDVEMVQYNGAYYVKRPKSSFEYNCFIDEEAEGLTKEQIRKIQQLGYKTAKVSQTIAFAPCMFLGMILTLIVKGNILIWVRIFIFS